MALKPIVDEPERYRDATVIFINDVATCPDDILELIFGAGNVPIFYVSYIASGMTGDLLFDISPGGSWDRATKLFWNDPVSKGRFDAGRPVQVFSCWNGAVAFRAMPVANQEVGFRAARTTQGECYNGEPEIFCQDLWVHGYGKIAMVRYINLEYSIKKGQRVKDIKGYTSETIASSIYLAKDSINWRGPPGKVKCMPTFDNQY